MRLFLSQSNNPFINLAFEETLLGGEGDAAFLWVNDPCVVIGRNQDPFQETDPTFLEAHGITLARRLSGGGAVYHDKGNLNYTIVSDVLVENRAADWALSALDRLGIHASTTGRNDIEVAGMKVGGLAEHFNGRSLQHGTLLVDADMNMLVRALRPSRLKLKKHGVASVESRVANLTSFANDLDVARLATAFEDALDVPSACAPISQEVLDHARKLQDPSWVFARHAPGDIELETVVNDDLYRLSLEVKGGFVQSAHITTDACRPPDLDAIAEQLKGRPLGRGAGRGVTKAPSFHMSIESVK